MNDHAGGASASNDHAGGFFAEAMLAAAMLNGEQEGRAYRGYCPKCGNNTLKIVHRDHGIVAKACNACGVHGVLGICGLLVRRV